MHRHASLQATAETYARSVLEIGPDDRCLSVAKLFFAYGLGNSLTFPLSVGASAVLNPRRPTPADVLDLVREERPTLFFHGLGSTASSPRGRSSARAATRSPTWANRDARNRGVCSSITTYQH